MSAKRAIIGFKGVALAPVTMDTIASYVTGAGVAMPYAGQMSRTVKENKTDVFYDDDLYAQLRNVSGEDVELRMAEIPFAMLETLGLGTYDTETETLEANFSITGKYFALRCVTDTVSGLPFYFNYRVFELTGIKFDNFATKKDRRVRVRGHPVRRIQEAAAGDAEALGCDAAEGRPEQSGRLYGVPDRRGDQTCGVKPGKQRNIARGRCCAAHGYLCESEAA